MIAFTVLAVNIVLWQGNDISVNIVSESDNGHNEVTISVLNTAGSTLLFYENAEICGKLEYLTEDGWVEYSDIRYTYGNASAISRKYGGTFAELSPGEDWEIAVPENILANMKDGTYRIKMTYVIENNLNKYLDNKFEQIVQGELDEEDDDEVFVNMFRPVSRPINSMEEENFIGEAICEIYIQEFDYEAPEDFLNSISFDDSIVD